MAKKGIKQTIEHIRKRAEANKISLKGKHNSPATEIKKGQHLSSSTEFKKGMISVNGFQKGQTSWNKGKKTGISHWLGKKRSIEDRKKMSDSHLGKTLSKETKLKMSETAKIKGFGKWMTGKKSSEETKRKIRESAFEYAKKVAGIICPRIGRNEKEILDKMETKLLFKIMRQFKVAGYFVDGYIPEIQLAIEVDEKPKNTERDIEREETIKTKLGCKFLRIKDYVE